MLLPDDSGVSPTPNGYEIVLPVAANRGAKEEVKSLLERGADANAQSGFTAVLFRLLLTRIPKR